MNGQRRVEERRWKGKAVGETKDSIPNEQSGRCVNSAGRGFIPQALFLRLLARGKWDLREPLPFHGRAAHACERGGVVQGKCNKTHGRAGDSYTLPWAFQHLATTLSEIFPSNSISDASQQTIARELWFIPPKCWSSDTPDYLLQLFIYCPHLKWPFTGMEWFPLPLVPYVIIFLKSHCIDLIHTIHLALQLSLLPTKERRLGDKRETSILRAQGACYNTTRDFPPTPW